MLRFLGWESILTDISAEVIRVHIIANYFSCLHTIYTIFIQNYPPCFTFYTIWQTIEQKKTANMEKVKYHSDMMGKQRKSFFILLFSSM